MKTKTLLILLAGFALVVGCGSPVTPAPVTQAPFLTITPTLFLDGGFTPGALTAVPNLTLTPVVRNPNVCADPQVTALIDSLKSAVLTSDGPLLSSLVSPQRGMDVAYFRDGTVINYKPEHARFLFETTFQVNWGTEPGSGAEKVGSFHQVIVPELVEAFNRPYTLHCNELMHGGATYEPEWPYEGDFYSIHFPGTQENGFLDWHTWAVGVEYMNSKPLIYALIPYFWEP